MAEETSTVEEEDSFDKMLKTWWGKIVFSLLMAALAFWLYSDLSALESGAVDSIRINRIIGLLYSSLGMWGALSIPIVLGLGSFGWGVKQLVSDKE